MSINYDIFFNLKIGIINRVISSWSNNEKNEYIGIDMDNL